MARLLIDFINESIKTQFEWGQLDCGSWVCDWIDLNTGHDPYKNFRGTYNSKAGCDFIVRGYGGEEKFGLHVFEEYKITEKAEKGDIGLILICNNKSMAIRVNEGWALKTNKRGIVFIRDKHVKPVIIWRINCLLLWQL